MELNLHHLEQLDERLRRAAEAAERQTLESAFRQLSVLAEGRRVGIELARKYLADLMEVTS